MHLPSMGPLLRLIGSGLLLACLLLGAATGVSAAGMAEPEPTAAGITAPRPGAPVTAVAASHPRLAQRLEAWPQWRLPAPLPRPGRRDLIYPDWFEGNWRATLHDLSDDAPDVHVSLRFQPDGRGAVVGDRAGNAAAIGRALLGENLLRVRDDPRNPNRQIAELSDDRQLESTVVGRREEQPDADTLLADELTLQVLHGPGDLLHAGIARRLGNNPPRRQQAVQNGYDARSNGKGDREIDRHASTPRSETKKQSNVIVVTGKSPEPRPVALHNWLISVDFPGAARQRPRIIP